MNKKKLQKSRWMPEKFNKEDLRRLPDMIDMAEKLLEALANSLKLLKGIRRYGGEIMQDLEWLLANEEKYDADDFLARKQKLEKELEAMQSKYRTCQEDYVYIIGCSIDELDGFSDGWYESFCRKRHPDVHPIHHSCHCFRKDVSYRTLWALRDVYDCLKYHIEEAQNYG